MKLIKTAKVIVYDDEKEILEKAFNIMSKLYEEVVEKQAYDTVNITTDYEYDSFTISDVDACVAILRYLADAEEVELD